MEKSSGLARKERLKSKKLIQKLFNDGKSITVYPFSVVFLKVNNYGPMDCVSGMPALLLFSVPKRLIRRAFQRNRIKRLMREAYRQNKAILGPGLGDTSNTWLLGFIYNGRTIPSYKETLDKINLILHRLMEENENASG